MINGRKVNIRQHSYEFRPRKHFILPKSLRNVFVSICLIFKYFSCSEVINCVLSLKLCRIKVHLPIIFDMNLDLSIGETHFEAMGRMAGHVAPNRKPRPTRNETIQPKPRAAAQGDRRVRMLARSVLYPNTRLKKSKYINK